MMSVVAEVPICLVPFNARVDIASLFGSIQLFPDERITFLSDTSETTKFAPAVPDYQKACERHQCISTLKMVDSA